MRARRSRNKAARFWRLLAFSQRALRAADEATAAHAWTGASGARTWRVCSARPYSTARWRPVSCDGAKAAARSTLVRQPLAKCCTEWASVDVGRYSNRLDQVTFNRSDEIAVAGNSALAPDGRRRNCFASAGLAAGEFEKADAD